MAGDRRGSYRNGIRTRDQIVAAQMIIGMLNASAELERWAPGIDGSNASELFAWPLFAGILVA